MDKVAKFTFQLFQKWNTKKIANKLYLTSQVTNRRQKSARKIREKILEHSGELRSYPVDDDIPAGGSKNLDSLKGSSDNQTVSQPNSMQSGKISISFSNTKDLIAHLSFIFIFLGYSWFIFAPNILSHDGTCNEFDKGV